MFDKLLKTTSLIAVICFIIVLYGIYSKMDNGRFTITNSAEGFIKVLDTRNGRLYFYNADEGYYILNYGDEIPIRGIKEVKVQELPR